MSYLNYNVTIMKYVKVWNRCYIHIRGMTELSSVATNKCFTVNNETIFFNTLTDNKFYK